MKRLLLLATLALILVIPATAQTPTGTLSGRVTDAQGALPGVSVQVTAPTLQGMRSAVSTDAGDYIFTFLPPGEYRVRFELAGFQTLETTVKVSAAQTVRLDATMPQSQVAEEVTVAGAYETIAATSTAATTMEKDLIDKLPVPKTVNQQVLLTAGVGANGPSGGISIQGAQSYESLFMINGVVVNDNQRGQALPLYIEDAVQETTTSTAAISAEYGRFAGGIVNTLTKSGGNDFHASLRATLNNDSWAAKTPETVEQEDKINPTYEATLGGRILRDRLWFFLAGRHFNQELGDQTYYTNIPFTATNNELRYETKLTYSPSPNHRFVGSYFVRESKQENYGFRVTGRDFMDLESIYDRSMPEDLQSFNYTGVVSDTFFVEAQYSARHFTFKDAGSRYTDLERGTPLWDYWGAGGLWNSPVFCAVCEASDETRDNQNIILKGTWFLSTPSLGSHDITFGVDRFNDKTMSNNWQSGSGYTIIADGFRYQGGELYPILLASSESTWIIDWRLAELTNGNDFETTSIFLNDRWRLNSHFSFNLGVRYDKNDGTDGAGNTTADDSKISPRLGLTYDIFGDGNWQLNASYGKYVTAIANSIGDSGSSAGQIGYLLYQYAGPDINADPDAAQVDNHTALRNLFGWFNSLSQDQKNRWLIGASLPGFDTFIPESLTSPSADELTIGAAKRLGKNGLIRFDYVSRTFHDFYISRTDMTTGTATDPYGQQFDRTFVENDDTVLERAYEALMVSASYRLNDTMSLGGNWTYSELRGNNNGENGGSGPLTSGVFQYPEYGQESWSYPTGYLAADQRNRGRLWYVWDFLSSKHHRMNLSVMESFFSGAPYGANGNISIQPYVTNPGYQTPPTSVGYWFTGRDAYRTDNITRTDLAIGYSFVFPAMGSSVELFVEPRVTNLFNEQGVVNVDTTVYTSRSSGRGLTRFNPFTSQPVECPQGSSAAQCQAAGANWMKGTDFGQPIAVADYQAPRTFTVSLGIRF
ncbi:MAG: TonB-dependent receptor [Chloroflexi bacterium]|nr:TonB-dependent receptor [Chloroflexota bacterium]